MIGWICRFTLKERKINSCSELRELLGFMLRVVVHYVQSFMVVLRYLHNCDCDLHEFVEII